MKHDLIIHYTPNEITRIVSKSICPVCKEKLDNNVETSNIGELVCSTTACLDTDDHYNIMFEYKDPKHILLITQVINFTEENKHYYITSWKDGDEHTEIEVKDLESDEFMHKYFDKQRIFNFNKFNRSEWIKELKTMMLLG